MTGRDRIILQKTINYARDAVKYISGMDFEQFMDDQKTISACAFCIGQIGELMKEVEERPLFVGSTLHGLFIYID